jgi:hypothetical protein
MGRIVGLWIVLGAVAEIEEPLAYSDGNEPTGMPTARLVQGGQGADINRHVLSSEISGRRLTVRIKS